MVATQTEKRCRCHGYTDPHRPRPRPAPGLAPRALRPHRPRPTGRRRARGLSGWRVSGHARGRHRARLGVGCVDRRHMRLEKLQTFWERITDRRVWLFTPDGDIYRKARNATSSFLAIMQGQPGFFEPRFPGPWLTPAGARDATSYYESTPLRETLLELIDFSLLNACATRFAVGAVNVLTGNFIYFDNGGEEIE